MKKQLLVGTLMSAACFAPALLAETMDTRVEKLEKELAELKKQTGGAPGNVSTTGVQISIGGFIKANAMLSDYSDGQGATAGIGEDFLVPSTIPTTGADGHPKTQMDAKASRLWLKMQTPTDAGVIKGHIEIDFEGSAQGDERISNSYSPRLRHAYLEFNNWLFGQTWSTFFNTGALPDVLDFVGPVGTIFVRQPQIRYSTGNFQLALENPSSTMYNGSENPFDDNTIPDMIGRYNFTLDNAAFSLAVMGREVAYENATEKESEMGYAVSFAGKLPIGSGGDDIRLMLNAGNALGRYMGLNAFRTAVIEADGSIELVDQWGVFAAYRHVWSQKWRSNLVLSTAQADNPDSAGDTVAAQYDSVHTNLIYTATSGLDLGAEAIYGRKELENGDSGSLNRLQLTAIYKF